MDAKNLKSDLCALAEAIKSVQKKVEAYSPDYAGPTLCMDDMLQELRAVWCILFHPSKEEYPCLKSRK